MIHKRLHLTLIYKSVLVFISLLTIAFVPADALAEANVSAEKQMLSIADSYFNSGIKSGDKQQKSKYLQKACERYYIHSLQNPNDAYSYVQMGRIYTLENNKKLANQYLSTSLNINPNDAFTNYHFGNYYYSVKKYRKAVESYKKAYENGMKANADLNLKIADTYEKLGDLQQANYYYKKAFLSNPKSSEIPEKIRSIEDTKYKNTGYYDLKRKLNENK